MRTERMEVQLFDKTSHIGIKKIKKLPRRELDKDEFLYYWKQNFCFLQPFDDDGEAEEDSRV